MQFLYPNVLFLLLLLIVLGFLISTNKDNLQRFFSKDILHKLTVNNKAMRNTTRNILIFITLILFTISLARPVINENEQKVKQKLIPIVIALDVSKSMKATDIYPSRISLAKKKLKQIIKISKNTTIGIVLFAQNSYIVSPLTEDFTSLKYIVDNLDTSINFVNGSNIFAVLEATNQILKDYSVKNLIILSDGGNDDSYIDELEFAKKNHINIYSIGLATTKGAPMPNNNGYVTDENGNIVTVALNKSIKNLSLNSGGGYIGFSLNDNDIDAILKQIQKESKKEEFDSKRIKTYTELFYYPLALGLFCLLVALSSLPNLNRSNILIFLVTLSFYPQTYYANVFDFKIINNAKQHYNDKNYKEAINDYQKVKESNERNYNLANSYYKNKNYKEAIKNYNQIITSNKKLEYKKLHNLGNCYAKSNKLEKAKELYEKALQLKDDKQTKENLEAVKKALQKKKQKKQNKKKNKDKDKKKKEKTNSKQKKIKKQHISDMEEKKWLKALQKKKAPIMLQKVKSTNYKNYNMEHPW